MPRTYGAAIPSYKLYKKSLAGSHIHKYIHVYKLYKKSLAGSHMHKYIYWNLHIINMFNVHVGVLFNRNNTIFVRYNLHIQAMKLSLPTLLRTGSNCRYHFSSDKNDLQCTVYMDIRIFFMQIPLLWFISIFLKIYEMSLSVLLDTVKHVFCIYWFSFVLCTKMYFHLMYLMYHIYAMWFEWIKELWTLNYEIHPL